MSNHLKTNERWNMKASVLEFLKNYQVKFDMENDAIDLRNMALNYAHGIIPVEDVHRAILTVIGPRYSKLTNPAFDPSGGAIIQYKDNTTSPRFAYIDWEDMYLWPIFQRDVIPNHIEKIYKDFNPTCIMVPCAIKITLDGKVIYCIWDGHHTLQTCRMMNYSKFPVWYIDVDHIPLSVIENAGFGNTDADRIKYGCWLAGTNMRRINGKGKRALSPYDEFMIGYETQDAQYVSMMNILKKHNCYPRRHSGYSGAFTQIRSGVECYELTDDRGIKGRYWDRALRFHRTVWPGAPLILEVFRPISYLYQRAELEGFTLTEDFDKELADLFVNKYGDPESVEKTIKESYWAAYHDTSGTNKIRGHIPEHDKDRVLNGMINLYVQNNGKFLLPSPTCQWRVF